MTVQTVAAIAQGVDEHLLLLPGQIEEEDGKLVRDIGVVGLLDVGAVGFQRLLMREQRRLLSRFEVGVRQRRNGRYPHERCRVCVGRGCGPSSSSQILRDGVEAVHGRWVGSCGPGAHSPSMLLLLLLDLLELLRSVRMAVRIGVPSIHGWRLTVRLEAVVLLLAWDIAV